MQTPSMKRRTPKTSKSGRRSSILTKNVRPHRCQRTYRLNAYQDPEADRDATFHNERDEGAKRVDPFEEQLLAKLGGALLAAHEPAGD